VYAYLTRSTLGCELTGKELENRFPATSFITLSWFLEGSVEIPASDGSESAQVVPRWLINGKLGPLVSRNRGDLKYFGLSMYPDAFAAVFGVAPKALEGRLLDARKVLSADGVALFADIAAASGDDERAALFERYMAAHIGNFKVSLWTAAVRVGTRLSVKLMARLLGLGQRQTIRTTQQSLGVGVADLRRFSRGEAAFSALSERIDEAQSVSLADIAAQAGYADQAHLTREAKAVTGRTPTEFLRQFQTEESDWMYRAMKSHRPEPPDSEGQG
jgi:AraC-like DNA-binding protein